MAKTINKDIDIFGSILTAIKAFEESKVPCHLLKAEDSWYIDRSKNAIKEWPNLYTLVKEK